MPAQSACCDKADEEWQQKRVVEPDRDEAPITHEQSPEPRSFGSMRYQIGRETTTSRRQNIARQRPGFEHTALHQSRAGCDRTKRELSRNATSPQQTLPNA